MSESFDKAVAAGSRRFWIEEAVTEGSDRDWAESAWDDMGGSEPNMERAVAELQFRAGLLAALPHLTAQDVPHLIRQAKAEAWEVGRTMGLADHSASMRAGRPLRTPNPYAEETTDDHA